MIQLTKSIIKYAAMLAIGGLLPMASNAAFAQSDIISNTATVQWSENGQISTSPSNVIEIEIDRTPPPSVALYHFGSGQNSLNASIPSTICLSNNGPVPVPMRGAFRDIDNDAADIEPANAIRAGEPLIIQVIAAEKNLNPNAIDSFQSSITTRNGDSETIILAETGENTSIFRAIINTTATPPSPVQGDCVLSVSAGDQLSFALDDLDSGINIGSLSVEILIDPFGISFDSGDGAPVDGTIITIVDAVTGQPADVFGDDGVSIYPSTVTTGGSVTDSGGTLYNFTPGFYRFPFLRAGQYRLIVTPPGPYTFASAAPPDQLANLTRPDGGQFTIADGSFGGIIILDDPAPVRVDIPLDRPGTPLLLRKTASKNIAARGDIVQYRVSVSNQDNIRSTGEITVTDILPKQVRLRAESVRYNNETVTADVASDGSSFNVTLPSLAGGESGLLTYLGEIRQDAEQGDAINIITATDSRGSSSNIGESIIRIERDEISERFSIIGRITDQGCSVHPNDANGIAGVRVILQDGRFAVTDQDGRYHFEGLKPGIQVVQIDPSSLPNDQQAIDCAQNTRSAGSAISQFVEGNGGALKRADFRTKTVAAENRGHDVFKAISKPLPEAKSDQQAAGADIDWLAGQSAGIDWLFPDDGYNPRVSVIRVAVKHGVGDKIELQINGKIVDPLSYDGLKKSADNKIAASIWRAIPVNQGKNILKAIVKDKNGNILKTLERNVHFSTPPVRAEFIKDQSILVADGVTRPRITVRLTDRSGRPIQHGSTGDFSVPAPYEAAVDVDAQQANQLSGLERADPVWRVIGDDGHAFIELAPTTASGTLSVNFNFRDGETVREQRIETWLDPGERPWTVVGFAAGTIGFNKLEEGLEDLAQDSDSDTINLDGRAALYAKGRVSGKWLLTLAYDSDKEEDETRFGGVIDPRNFYTIYADRSEQRFDAASVRRLYLKLERPQFFALFGDYETAINEPQLARYQRSFNGVKAEFRNDQISANAFAADTPFRFRREEIQGNGLSGPYALSARDIIANSERVTIETRDRIRSNLILNERPLVRNIDYDIDYANGTLIFREPILSRDSALNPQFIVATYEVSGIGERVTNAGGRVRWQDKEGKIRVAATAIHDETDNDTTNLGGVDIVFAPGIATEIRAEIAVSDSNAKAANTGGDAGTSSAWLVEAEHHGNNIDVLAYVREQNARFGIGQQNASEIGSRKIGAEGRLRIYDDLQLSVLTFQENFFETNARRRSTSGEIEYRAQDTKLSAGIARASDRLADGQINRSTLAKLGASQSFLNNKLELSAQSEFALGGQDDSIDFPSRHRFGVRYSVRPDIQLIAGYEIADGENIDSRTARVGFDIAPWSGARITASGNQQDINEFGPRTFAAYGLAQSFRLNEKWSLDFSLDGNKTLNGFDNNQIINPAQPVASGGFLASDGALTEDFTAVTSGATYRGEKWSWVNRAEYRNAQTNDRYGLTSAILRQISEGVALGAAISYFDANQEGGAQTKVIEGEISWAYRPSNSRWSILDKTEFRSDSIRNAIAGNAGPIGGAALTISGDAVSRRVINSISINYSPIANNDGGNEFFERGEYSLFWGTRYVFDRFGEDDVEGWSNIIGADARFDISNIADIGGQGTVRIGANGSNIAYSGGPVLTVSPFKNSNISIGYNIVGFRDRDFEDARYTRSGPFLTFKLKFDQNSFSDLGL